MTGGAGALPVYQRFVNGVPVPGGGGAAGRRTCRLREKYLILSVLLTFAVVWLGALFYLPEFRSTSGDSVYSVYRRIQKAGPELLLPPPPHEASAGEAPPARHGDSREIDPHLLDDRDRLRAKIEQDPSLKVLERPQLDAVVAATSPRPSPAAVAAAAAPVADPALQAPAEAPERYAAAGEDPDPAVRAKRDTVKEMMRHAWSNYKRYAWGKNELKPISKRPHLASLFGGGDLGASIVDGLDTLYLMGMHDEFRDGRDWLAKHFRIAGVDTDLSVFETTIRFVGGLLSCYALTGDVLFRDKAAEVADALLPAFDTPTGLPYALINPSSKSKSENEKMVYDIILNKLQFEDYEFAASRQYHWAGANSILSEVGTLHMEFSYLSDITGNDIYRQKVDRIRQVLNEAEKPDGLYPNYINPRSGLWGQRHMSLGALGDSFYEYLLKAWLVSGRADTQARDMFDASMRPALDKMLRVSLGGLSYLAEIKYGRIFDEKMDHLSCFTGGMLALASKTLDNDMSERYMDVGTKLTHTCHESYDRSNTKLGPEAFRFTGAVEARGQKSNEKTYLLRPETFESYFVLWRLTRDEKYREWGWEAVQALERHCRVDGGYTGLVNVYHDAPQGDDVQQSFFLAETLKYLYLLFSDDSILPLDQWVFNTEAHPLPVKGSALYRAAAPGHSAKVADNPLDLQVLDH